MTSLATVILESILPGACRWACAQAYHHLAQCPVIHVHAAFKEDAPGSMERVLPCCRWLSIMAQSRLLAAVMACISPVKWRLMSSMGTTWE